MLFGQEHHSAAPLLVSEHQRSKGNFQQGILDRQLPGGLGLLVRLQLSEQHSVELPAQILKPCCSCFHCLPKRPNRADYLLCRRQPVHMQSVPSDRPKKGVPLSQGEAQEDIGIP